MALRLHLQEQDEVMVAWMGKSLVSEWSQDQALQQLASDTMLKEDNDRRTSSATAINCGGCNRRLPRGHADHTMVIGEHRLATPPERKTGNQSLKWFLGPAFAKNDEDMQAFVQSTRLPDCEALLIDPGAFDNLTGDEWVNRVKAAVNAANLQVTYRSLERPLGIEGVGAGGQQAVTAVQVLGAILDQQRQRKAISYEAPVVAHSSIPALLGRRSLARNRAVLDMINNKLYLCGPGRIHFIPPPGTIEVDLTLSDSGHLMMPITPLATNHSSQDLALNFITSLPKAIPRSVGEDMSREERKELCQQAHDDIMRELEEEERRKQGASTGSAETGNSTATSSTSLRTDPYDSHAEVKTKAKASRAEPSPTSSSY